MHNLGIMVNNRCNAACVHCLYASSPCWDDDYITQENAKKLCQLLKSHGVYSVHIGGGEPFLNFESLYMMLTELKSAGISVDYIETNGFWCYEEQNAKEKIRRVRELSGNTLMVSCDPFHAEFVPVQRVMNFVRWCLECNMDFFVWHDRYLRLFQKSGRDLSSPFTRAELEGMFGKDYREQTASEYGLSFNGRALRLLDTMVRPRSVEELLPMCRNEFSRAFSTGHVDLNLKFWPNHCLGFGVDMDWVLDGAKEGRYPLIDMVRKKGLKGLYELCTEQGFQAKDAYTSPCALCMACKAFLSGKDYEEIYPKQYFENV